MLEYNAKENTAHCENSFIYAPVSRECQFSLHRSLLFLPSTLVVLILKPSSVSAGRDVAVVDSSISINK